MKSAKRSEPHAFMARCGFLETQKYVESISGVSGVVQMQSPATVPSASRSNITLWGEDHSQPNACNPCQQRSGCWYMPLLLSYCDGPLVVLGEAPPSRRNDLTTSVRKGWAHDRSMLYYAHVLFTEQTAEHSAVEAFYTDGLGWSGQSCVSAGTSCPLLRADGTLSRVRYIQTDMRRQPLLPSQWRDLRSAFPDLMDLFMLRSRSPADTGPQLEEARRILTRGTTLTEVWDGYKRFAMAFTVLCFPDIRPDHLQRLVADVLVEMPAQLPSLYNDLVADGWVHDGDVIFRLNTTLFRSLMDIAMVIHMERVATGPAPTPFVHAVMGLNHLVDVVRALERRGFGLVLARNDGYHGDCFHVPSLTFRAIEPRPATVHPPYDHPNGTSVWQRPGDPHFIEVVPHPRAFFIADDARTMQNIVVGDDEADVPHLRYSLTHWVPRQKQVLRLDAGPLKPLFQFALFRPVVPNRRSWVPESNETIRDILAIRALLAPPLDEKQVVSHAARFLGSTVGSGTIDMDLEPLMQAAYSVADWRPTDAADLAGLPAGTKITSDAYFDAVSRILGPMVAVRATLEAQKSSTTSNVRIWVDPGLVLCVHTVLAATGFYNTYDEDTADGFDSDVSMESVIADGSAFSDHHHDEI